VVALDKIKNIINNRLNISNLNISSNTPLYFKLFVILFLTFSATIVSIAYQLEKHIEATHIEVVKDELMSIASIAAFYVDGDIVEELRESEQEQTAEYAVLQQRLIQIMKDNKKIRDVYVLRKGEHKDELVFVVDAAELEEHSPLGEIYDAIIAPEMLKGFIQPAVDKDFTTDKWGQTLSGYAPVRNSHGDVVAILGIDFDANDIRAEYNKRSERVLFYAVLGMLLMLMLSLVVAKKLVERLNNIKCVIDMLLEENLDTSVHDTGKDEIKDLSLRVNQLIKKMVADREQMFICMITALVNALEAKDQYTYGHSADVADIADDIMNEMQLDANEKFTIRFAAILHDIGKIGISDIILQKKGKLTETEFSVIRQHPLIGAKILEGIPALNQIQDIVQHHHERYDGTGYPDKLRGLDISLGARIIAVADSFQAMISDRTYHSGMSQKLAMKELEENKGTQFDPHIVDVFLALCKNKQYKE